MNVRRGRGQNTSFICCFTRPQPPARACLPAGRHLRQAPEPLTHFGHRLGGKRTLESPLQEQGQRSRAATRSIAAAVIFGHRSLPGFPQHPTIWAVSRPGLGGEMMVSGGIAALQQLKARALTPKQLLEEKEQSHGRAWLVSTG